MLTLQAAYLQAYEQHRVVWAQIMGDPGIGKSRLLEDLSDWMDLREETYRLLRARAFPDDANQPFALIRRMWFDRFQIAEDTPLAQAEAKWVERFKEFSDLDEYEEPAQALGLLVGLSFKDSSFIGAMRNDPIQVKGRALVVSRQLIWSVCRRYPIVVLLEDLQWADRASWEYLSDVFLSAPAESPGNGIFILGTARQGWTPPESLASLLKIPSEENNSASNWRTLISLAPLSERASHELAQELLQRAVNIPDPVIDLLVKRSEGVPYYMEEIVNWLIDRGILDTHGEQWRFLPDRLKEEPLPATLQHLLLTRLSSLSQSDRAVLQRGSIFGRHFWTGGVEALGVQHSAEILEHLQMRGFIEVQFESAFQGDNEWSFHHNLLQEVAYESVLKRERAALHKMAAAWLERQANQAGRLDEFAGLLGEHTERAGELSIAADWYLRAGRRIAAQGSPREAKVFFTRAMDLLPPIDRERRWQALLGREETLSVLAEAEPWKADITALLDLARSFEDDNYLAEAYLRQAVFGNRRGDIHISELASREALAATRRCGNTLMEAKALALTAMAEVDRGDTTATRQKIEEALNLARSLNDENVLAFVLFRASYCYTILGDFASQYHLKIEQIELDHRLGNRAQEATGLGNLGNHYLKLGLYKQARAALEQASNICKSLGTRRSLAYDLINLASLCLATRDLRQAYQLAEEALQEISPFMDARGEASALNYNGRVLLAMGDVLGASRRFTKGQELTLSQQLFAMTCESRTGLATCAVLQGQLGDAHSLIYAVWDYLRDHGWVGLDSPGWVYRACAETFDALGEEENGMAVIESGYKALMEMADKINVPSWRQSFLENVPDNRAIIEIWERRKDWIQPG